MSLLTPSFHLPLICSLQLLQPVSSDMIGRPHSLCSLPAKLNIRLQSVIEISRVRQLPNGSFHSYGRLAVAAGLSLHAGPWQPIGAPISSGIAPAGSLLLRPPRLASKQFPWPETNDKAWWDVCLAYRGPLLIWQLGATFWDCQLKSSLGRAHPVAPWWEGRPSWKLNGHSQVDVSPSLHRSLQAYLSAARCLHCSCPRCSVSSCWGSLKWLSSSCLRALSNININLFIVVELFFLILIISC